MWRLRLTQSLIMLTVRVRSFEKRTNFPHSSVRLLAFTCVRFHLLDAIGKSDARPSCAAGADVRCAPANMSTKHSDWDLRLWEALITCSSRAR